MVEWSEVDLYQQWWWGEHCTSTHKRRAEQTRQLYNINQNVEKLESRYIQTSWRVLSLFELLACHKFTSKAVGFSIYSPSLSCSQFVRKVMKQATRVEGFFVFQ